MSAVGGVSCGGLTCDGLARPVAGAGPEAVKDGLSR
jgi:hypothetical protein